MTWTELTRSVAESAGAPVALTRRVLDALLDEISSSLEQDREVKLPRVGTLAASWREPQTVRSLDDGRKMLVGGRHVVKFRASGVLRERLAARTPQRWRDPAHQQAWRLAETLVADLAAYHPTLVPVDLPEDASAERIEELCAAAFGTAWDTALAAYAARTSPETQAECYLGLSARRRWTP